MTTPRQAVTATQTDTIRAHLMTGATISTWEAYELYQITCLAQRVHDIRRSGIDIKSEIMVKNGKRFSLYWVEEQERARYVSGQVNPPTNARGTGCGTTNQDDGILASINEATKGHRASHEALAAVNANDGVWVTYDYIDNLLRALTTNSKTLKVLARLVNIKNSEEADKINDCSMDVADIAMSLTLATTSVRPNSNSPCISGTWLTRSYLKRLKRSIDGKANGLETIVILARLTRTYMHGGVSEASMGLIDISASIGELLTND